MQTPTADTKPLPDGAATDAEDLTVGSCVGRYLVLERIGRGGMGEVYSAYDPELDRKIAVKLLRPGRDGSQRRLLQEAQTLAQIGHPNVVHVYDVGRLEGRVFLAMELVAGKDLSARLQEEPPWTQVLRWLLEAGSGLAAAHRASVLHRDLKPGNVLVGDDGRVRVGDFGIARRVDAEGEARGGPAGTPPYLAPEQHDGEPPDVRSDLYQFAVMAWRALYGRLPFEGGTDEALVAAKRRGPPDPPESPVPRRVHRVLRRALDPDPARRHPSMEAMLAELEHAVSSRRRGLTVAAAVGALLAGGAVLWPNADPCTGARERLAPVWSPARAAAVTAGLRRTEAEFAETAARQTVQTLDAYTERWARVHRETCEATRVRAEQSEELMDLRMHCLSRRLHDVDALAGQLEQADVAVAANAVAAAYDLPGLAECEDPLALTEPQRPADPGVVAAVEKIERGLAEADARRRAGRYEEAVELAASVRARAEQVDHAPTIAEARLAHGRALSAAGHAGEAAAALRGAVAAAEIGRASRIKARAWSWLVFVVGVQDAEIERAREYAELARATNEAAGESPELTAELETALGLLAKRMGELEAAGEHQRRALALRTRIHGEDSLEVAASLNNLGNLATALGDHARAREHFERALRIRRTRLGEGHPEVGQVLGHLATVLAELGEVDAALDAHERSLEIRTSVLGPEHPETLSARINMATGLWRVGRFEEAITMGRAVADASTRVHGPWHARTVRAHNNVVGFLSEGARLDEARALCFERMTAPDLDPTAKNMAIAAFEANCGEVLRSAGDPQTGLVALQRALARLPPEPTPVRSMVENALARFD